MRGKERATTTARAGATVGTTEPGPDEALDVACSTNASTAANPCGRERGKSARGVGGTRGPSSAAAGVAKPMAQSAAAIQTWRTKVFMFMESIGRDASADERPSRAGLLRVHDGVAPVPSAGHGRVVRSVNRRLDTGLTTHQGAGRPVSDRPRGIIGRLA